MAVVYPISSEIPIEDEDDTRRKIEALHRQALRERQERSWTPQELEALYRDCCRVREEHPLKKMRLVFEEAARASPPALKTLDLSFLPLDRQAIDPLADLLSVDFGLSKLVLENCGLTDDGLKAILHALLISGTLPNLSLASNRRLKYTGWRYVAIFMRRARALRYLDLSENSINRASLQHIVDAIRKPPEAVTRAQKPQEMATAAPTAAPADGPVASGSIGGADYDEEGEPLMPSAPLLREVAEGGDGASLTTAVISLRLENCGLKGSSLAQLAQAVRFSDIKHISLRRNRISPMGAVALAAMLKDYPDAQSSPSHSSVPTAGAVPGESTAGVSDVATVGSNLDAQSRGSSPVLPEIPLITSTPTGGVTARHVPPSTSQPGTVRYHTQMTSQGASNSVPGQDASAHSTAVALANARRAKKMLDSMPRLGNLLTVDLKSNDIRDGVTYLAQMLKKNRTLRVLNLSDNHIDMHGLVALAEALKYNSTLETLDVSHNPCAGPALEGITTLRTAFALNSNLKRLFMNDTDLSSEGAIALAEFLPEARSLIHLDLTENFEVDIAGVMALAVSVKMNKSLRCLDLNIPPNDPDFARLSQEILQSCIRNTQLAQKRAQQKGLQQPVAAPIYKSVVARAAQEKDERAKAMEKARLAEQSAMEAAAANRAQSQDKLIDAAEQCYVVLRDLLTGEERRLKDAQSTDKQVTTATAVAPDFVDELVAQSNSLRQRLIKVIGTMNDEGDKLAKALSVTDDLEAITARLIAFYKSSSSSSATSTSTSRDGSRRNSNEGVRGADAGAATLKPPPSSEDADISSPSFSVGSDDDDDDDDDDEDEDEGRRDGIRQGVNLDTDLSRATRGLGIDDGGSIGIVAEKEPELEVTNAIDGQPRSPRSESRARTMVDEEGEVFRKAKILEMQEEEEHEGVATESVLSQGRRAHDDDDGGSDAAPASSGAPVASGSDDGAPLSEEGEADADGDRSSTSAITTGQTTTTTSAAESTPARRRSSSSSSSISLSVTAEASGEEIRRQLLEAS